MSRNIKEGVNSITIRGNTRLGKAVIVTYGIKIDSLTHYTLEKKSCRSIFGIPWGKPVYTEKTYYKSVDRLPLEHIDVSDTFYSLRQWVDQGIVELFHMPNLELGA